MKKLKKIAYAAVCLGTLLMNVDLQAMQPDPTHSSESRISQAEVFLVNDILANSVTLDVLNGIIAANKDKYYGIDSTRNSEASCLDTRGNEEEERDTGTGMSIERMKEDFSRLLRNLSMLDAFADSIEDEGLRDGVRLFLKGKFGDAWASLHTYRVRQGLTLLLIPSESIARALPMLLEEVCLLSDGGESDFSRMFIQRTLPFLMKQEDPAIQTICIYAMCILVDKLYKELDRGFQLENVRVLLGKLCQRFRDVRRLPEDLCQQLESVRILSDSLSQRPSTSTADSLFQRPSSSTAIDDEKFLEGAVSTFIYNSWVFYQKKLGALTDFLVNPHTLVRMQETLPAELLLHYSTVATRIRTRSLSIKS